MKQFGTNRIIWQYWGQGFDDADIPEVVRMCMDSVTRYADDAVIVHLSDKNLDEYLRFPDWLKQRFRICSKAFFSDFLRCCLLYIYGGCWLDATVLLSNSLPQRYWDADLFLFRREDSERNKKYWVNVFAQYFGWHKDFKVRSLSSILFCKKGNGAIGEIARILAYIYKSEERLPHYFLLQILMEVMIESGRISGFQSENDCLPHYLQQFINDPDFNLATFQEIMEMTSVHKLTYKFDGVADRLQRLMADNNG